MKITQSKVLKELQEKHGWSVYKDLQHYEQAMVKNAIKDTITVIDEILKQQKGISIKK